MSVIDELGLTPAQLDCARVVHELIEMKGYAPSYDEIAAEMDLRSRSRVHFLVSHLRDRGWLTLAPAHARSIRMLRTPPPVAECTVEITPEGLEAAARLNER